MNKPTKIYAEILEQGALDQFNAAMELDCIVKGALMPDAHTGYSLPIGAVVASDGMIFPSFVGYDIGCGMCAIPLDGPADDIRANAKAIFDNIYRDVPTGFAHNKTPEGAAEWWESSGRSLNRTAVVQDEIGKNALNQIGSLGQGNHFCEVGEDETGRAWIILHSGSRNLGHKVCTHYMKLASPDGKAREGHFGFRTDSRGGQDYIADMNFCLEFALANRREIIRRVTAVISRYTSLTPDWLGLINRNHNHAELNSDGYWVHRKGATHAELGMMGVIPGNMRDGSFIVRGKGCSESLCSSSHGAGRVMGRKKAAELVDMDDFRASMAGIQAKVCYVTKDEAPMAYKNIFEVMELQRDLVDVVAHVRPIINIKA